MKKIGFVTDTNILKLSKNLLNKNTNIFKGIDFYLEYINDLSKVDKKNELIYYMPTYVLDELITQKLIEYNSIYEYFKNTFNDISYGLNGELPSNDIFSKLNVERLKYEKKLKIISIDYEEKIFQKLIKDAFERNAPFDKTAEGKKADSGFKDAVIWNTVLNSNEISECDEFYFFSGDNIFVDNKEVFVKEFNQYHPNVKINILFVKPDGSQQQKSLQAIIDDHNLIETEKIKLFNENLIINDILKLNYELERNISYIEETKEYYLEKINFDSFDSDDFNIDNVITKDDNKYEVRIEFDTLKYKLKETQDIDNTKKINGLIIMIYQKENKKFKLLNYEIKNVEFMMDGFSYLMKGISNVMHNLYDNNFKTTIDALTKTITEQMEPMSKLSESLRNIAIKNLDYNTKYINNILLPNFNDDEVKSK